VNASGDSLPRFFMEIPVIFKSYEHYADTINSLRGFNNQKSFEIA
jgi:hypothetical protein